MRVDSRSVFALAIGLATMSQAAVTVAVAATAVAPAGLFQKQWAWKNTGQNVCNSLGSNCQAGTPGVDVKAVDAWTQSADCTGVTVAVLDTGMDATHPDLKNNFVGGRNLTVDPTHADFSNISDDNLHGTHVAGTIGAAGTEAFGAKGVCEKARIFVLKVADKEGRLADSDIVEGFKYAQDHDFKVLNASFGGEGRSTVMERAIKAATNVLFVVAAGNGDMFTGVGFDISRRFSSPASFTLPNLITIAATDNKDGLARFSNYSATLVHLAAPGVAIYSTAPVIATEEMKQDNLPTSYMSIDGTSMATPHVTGAAALYWTKHPASTPAQVKARLIATAEAVTSVKSKVVSAGRLNLKALVAE